MAEITQEQIEDFVVVRTRADSIRPNTTAATVSASRSPTGQTLRVCQVESRSSR
jgi:hypothetical protein